MLSLGFTPDPSLRTLAQTRMVEQLMLWGWAYELAAGEADAARAAAEAALERWVGLGLGVETGQGGARRFDPVEVMNAMIALGQDGLDDVWESRVVDTARRLVQDLAQAGPRFSFELSRDYRLGAALRDTRLRLRLPLPVDGPALTTLELATRCSAHSALSHAPGRLEALVVAGGASAVELSAVGTVEAHPTGPYGEALDEAERALYLRPSEGLITVTDAVCSAAAEVGAAAYADLDRVRAFHGFLLDRFTCGATHYRLLGPAPADTALTDGWFDCQVGSALFCALCRASGIPARLLSGFQLHAPIGAHHYWAEAWIEGQGWTPFDLAAWRLSMGGRDAQWREVYAGTIDPRLTVQVFPRVFTGPSSVKFPPLWRMVTRAAPEGGVEMAYEDIDTGALAWRDRFAVRASP